MDYFNTPFKGTPGKSDNAEREKIKSIGPGVAKTRKKSTGKKLIDTFIKEDIGSVKDYIISEVIVPGLKDAISSVINNGTDMLLFGEPTGYRGRSRSNNSVYGSRVSYNSYSNSSRNPVRKRDGKPQVCSPDEIIFDDAGKAHQVLENLRDYLQLYGRVSILDLYDAAGLQDHIRSTDNKYGWFNLDYADVKRLRNGEYLLAMPKPEVLD